MYERRVGRQGACKGKAKLCGVEGWVGGCSGDHSFPPCNAGGRYEQGKGEGSVGISKSASHRS